MNEQQINDYLDQCVRLAASRLGFTAPNPAVGALIVHNDQVIATGCHHQAGDPHAEVMAFQAAGNRDLSDAILFVSLEPCCHTGRTPPCTDAIIASGIRRVYFAHCDINPAVAGKSAAILAQAGIEAVFVDRQRAQDLYRYYDYWRQHQRPFVTAKLAISRDGKYASCSGAPVAITGLECQRFTHQQRSQADALLTTVKTVIADDPQLNVRLDETAIAKPVFVLDRHLQFPLKARLWHTAQSITLLHQENADAERLRLLQQQGAQCIALPLHNGHLSWSAILDVLGQQGMHHVWVEAGARLFCALWQADALQQIYLYVATKALGADARSAPLKALISESQWACFSVCSLGDDYCFSMNWCGEGR